MPRLALFDLDGTLADRQSALSDAVTRLRRTHALTAGAEQWLRTELADRANVADFARLRATFALEVSAAQLWQEYVGLMAAASSCRPEVLEGLAHLRASGWTVGIVTNGASDIQRAKLTATGLADLVDGVAVSGDLEIRKPEPKVSLTKKPKPGTTGAGTAPKVNLRKKARDADRLNTELAGRAALVIPGFTVTAQNAAFDVSDHESYTDPHGADVTALLAAAVAGVSE
ncbi:HAD family hydrolase [Streptomyces sp. NBC_01233]|uniref:HAD family hydrolase n=1 Tax=Streptomyces sp. NBC_01233 TaxID=2903787 RepID=UPI002E11B0AD|nr:HAD family hydrolase [Streptomyces sp. NBC_01233]